MIKTKVSSHMYISRYPCKFNLKSLHCKEEMEKINIPANKTYFNDRDFYDDEDKDMIDVTGKYYYNDFESCMYNLSELGCAFSDDIYLGSGEHFGSVWNYGDDLQWHKSASSLKDYIINNFHKC
jgi:hypothetical protein